MMRLDADELFTRARKAQHAWGALTVASRCRKLASLRRIIAEQSESIAEAIACETGKPLLDALSGDVMVSLEHLRFCEAHAPRILHASRIGKPSFFFRQASFTAHHEPHGVVLIFGPSNYPLQLSVIPAVTALAAGNAVVLKCSERTPATAALIASLCAKAGFTRDLVQVLHCGPEEASELIDAGPDFIFFTGSSLHGVKVAERAASRLIPCILELGGKDAALVFADCHLERTIEGITYGAFLNSGRVCVAVRRVYVEASIYEDFLALLRQRIANLRIGSDGDSDLHPLNESEQSSLRSLVDDALSHGATLNFPLSHNDVGRLPALLTDVPPHAKILTQESFGPALVIAPFSTEDEAIEMANASPFALSSSVWTRNPARARRIASRLSSGSCAVNDVIRVIANPHAPFGGNRLSGHGRYHGAEGLRAFSRVKTVMVARNRREREISWFPFTASTRRQLMTLLRFRHASSGIVARLGRILLPLLAFCFLAFSPVAQASADTHLTIDVQLSTDAHGDLAYLVFASPSGFPGDWDKAVRRGFLRIPPGAHSMRIDTSLPPGTYAVSVYEDLNRNHKLDHNWLGIPREPVGASNNPHPRFGPPHFSDCTFRLLDHPSTIRINLVKAL